ncbi:hypothetical protein MUO66_03050 [Candidatus Bathyarchaeota archaeon]|nr:hypothetical protein [Candidatus Bathyarchaeota archaeon]
MKNKRNSEFILTLIILLATLILSMTSYVFWYQLLFFVGSYLFIHWLGIIATIFIAVSIPIYIILKRTSPQQSRILLKLHVFGNLFAFLVVSIHFAQNLARLAGFLQRLGDGLALYLVLLIIVTTGILERYQTSSKLQRYTKFIHKYTVIILYLIILIHTLEGFNILIL